MGKVGTGARQAERIQQIIESLERLHGRPRFIPRFDPMDELISCILSQHTNDARSFPTFTHLRETYPTWKSLADAPVEGVARCIQGAGLSNQKSKWIKACLQRIHAHAGEYDLGFLRQMSDAEARKWLEQLPGVGPKTSCIVLCFALGREVIPVDTHVHRTSIRLGVIEPTVNEQRAHDLLPSFVPNGWSFRYHVTLIQHGRTTCRAQRPLCSECLVADLCPRIGVQLSA